MRSFSDIFFTAIPLEEYTYVYAIVIDSGKKSVDKTTGKVECYTLTKYHDYWVLISPLIILLKCVKININFISVVRT